MTVADLIRELQAMPLQSAAVMVRVVVHSEEIGASDFDFIEVDDVRSEGPFVSIRSR